MISLIGRCRESIDVQSVRVVVYQATQFSENYFWLRQMEFAYYYFVSCLTKSGRAFVLSDSQGLG